MGWKEVSGEGAVFTYTVAYHAVHEALKGFGPYNVVVLLDGADEVRLVSNLVDVAPADIRIGMPVSVHWDALDNGMVLPRFRKAVKADPSEPNAKEAS